MIDFFKKHILSKEEKQKRHLNSALRGLSKTILKGDVSFNKIPIESLYNLKKVEGTLDLDDCTLLKELPGDLEIEGSLLIANCISLKELPKTLKVKDGLFLNETLIKEIPFSTINGDLSMLDCPNLNPFKYLLNIKGSCWISLNTFFKFKEENYNNLNIEGHCYIDCKKKTIEDVRLLIPQKENHYYYNYKYL